MTACSFQTYHPLYFYDLLALSNCCGSCLAWNIFYLIPNYYQFHLSNFFIFLFQTITLFHYQYVLCSTSNFTLASFIKTSFLTSQNVSWCIGAARLPGFYVCVGGGGERLLPEWYTEKGKLVCKFLIFFTHHISILILQWPTS